jgi:hypothetical protein
MALLYLIISYDMIKTMSKEGMNGQRTKPRASVIRILELDDSPLLLLLDPDAQLDLFFNANSLQQLCMKLLACLLCNRCSNIQS